MRTLLSKEGREERAARSRSCASPINKESHVAICFNVSVGACGRESAPEDRPQGHPGPCRQHKNRWRPAYLVVSPVGKGEKARFQIVSGSRRFEALRLLQERSELPEDFTVAVEVRDNLSLDDTLRIATVENL